MMSSGKFTVRAGNFEGPLELLLELIEKRKLHISDVSLATVADEYIQHVETLDGFPTNEVAHFILIASTLLLIKSKSLLPGFSLTQEEEQDVHDLERRLRLYKRMRSLSRHIKERFGSQVLFSRNADTATRNPVFTPSEDLSISALKDAVLKLVEDFPTPPKLSRVVVDKVMSLEEMIEKLADRIQSGLRMGFNEFAKNGKGGREQQLNVIVSFLAMLELVKQGAIAVQQEGAFDDIEMETQEISTPRY